MATPKLEQQLPLAKELNFQEVVIPVDEAEEALEALRTVRGESLGQRATYIPED